MKRGWTHLLEHMAMHEGDHPNIQCNASVDLTTTAFHVTGEEPDIVGFLEGLTRWLSDPRLEALEHEREILQREASQSYYGDAAMHLGHRYGAVGPGVADFRELGLHVVTAEGLREHARRFFTTGNAALALTVSPPAGLELTLPPGDRVRLPEAVEIVDRYRRQFVGRTPRASVSGHLTDSWVSPLVQELATQAVTARLRRELGLSYATSGTVEGTDDNTLLMVLSSDIDPQRPEFGVRQLSIAIESLAQHGVSLEEFEGVRKRLLRSLGDELTGAWQAFSSAQAVLQGRQAVTLERVRDALISCTPGTADEQLSHFRSTALFAAPRGADAASGLPVSDPTRQAHFSGVPRAFRDWNAASRSKLEISDRSIMASGLASQYVKTLDQATALLCFGDGARTPVVEDGSSFFLDNHAWRDGDRAVAMLDRAVPAHLHIPMEARPAADLTPAPTHRKRALYPLLRLWHAARRALSRSYQLLSGVVLGLALIAAGVLLTGHDRARAGSYLLMLGAVVLGSLPALQRFASRKR